jgi:hypothetical protein
MIRYQRHVRIGSALERQIAAIFDDWTVQYTTYVTRPDQPWWVLLSSRDTDTVPEADRPGFEQDLLNRGYTFAAIEREFA